MISNSRPVNNQLIDRAVRQLRQGQLVAFPTETVYGLGADANNPEALKRLYQAKGRPHDHPVIVHIAKIEQLNDWVSHTSPAAQILAKKFWPGPLTLILPKAKHVLPEITGGQNSIGIRIPKHPVALSLLKSFASGIAAPSANKFGKLSTTSAQDVANEFKDEIAMVLDGGNCEVGIESTIVSCIGDEITILRPGIISAADIQTALAEHSLSLSSKANENIKVPGSLPAHYAPHTPLVVLPKESLIKQIEIEQQAGKKIAILAINPIKVEKSSLLFGPNDAHRYAKSLYSNLRKLDQSGSDVIFVEEVPKDDMWTGIADRLRRASYIVQ